MGDFVCGHRVPWHRLTGTFVACNRRHLKSWIGNLAMLDNGQSLVVEGCKVTLLAAERSFKSISGMVELVRGIVPMGSAQTAEFEWVSPRGGCYTCGHAKD
jgi:hypothetical protein